PEAPLPPPSLAEEPRRQTAPGPRPATPSHRWRERTTVGVELGACRGLWLLQGTTTRCGRRADIELSFSAQGGELRLRAAEGVWPLPAGSFAAPATRPQGPGAIEVVARVGEVYAIAVRDRQVVVRIVAMKGLEAALRARKAVVAAANELPRLPRPAGERPPAPPPLVRIELEWLVTHSQVMQ
ncbi:MAG: hypothetical protein ACE5MH_09460, partial [Terriglobia bacterium]